MFNRSQRARDIRLERMFETRSDAWHRVGLAMDVTQRTARKARRQAAVVLPLLAAVLVLYSLRKQILGIGATSPWDTPVRAITVIALLALGWALARDIGRAAAPV